ncbi:MAG: hypothetical protein EOS17_16795 [Mesorhizobium sp.]|nr:MAG: hypothetical protein EOS17_16795 [Mesorhizobium sp.]
MTVVQASDGSGGWLVISHGETLAGPFPTNAEAWRAADRIEGSPISPSEKRADWISNKILSRGPAPIVPDRTRQQKKRGVKNRKAKNRKAQRIQINAHKPPAWIRSIAAANFDPNGKRKYRDAQLGTFGAASPVRHIDPAEYLAASEGRQN